jgi:hypothetical protein
VYRTPLPAPLKQAADPHFVAGKWTSRKFGDGNPAGLALNLRPDFSVWLYIFMYRSSESLLPAFRFPVATPLLGGTSHPLRVVEPVSK